MIRAGKNFIKPKEPTKTTNLDGLWGLNEINSHIGSNNWPDLSVSVNEYNIGLTYLNYLSQGLKPNYNIGTIYINIIS
ncbi:MAG: hypothetical protein EBU90_14350 [Proteobacteria bacterium]|nr:hypothetical protein [Pseudomonadota bacterium]NBP16018.1 hypothetical protein [bacterium]